MDDVGTRGNGEELTQHRSGSAPHSVAHEFKEGDRSGSVAWSFPLLFAALTGRSGHSLAHDEFRAVVPWQAARPPGQRPELLTPHVIKKKFAKPDVADQFHLGRVSSQGRLLIGDCYERGDQSPGADGHEAVELTDPPDGRGVDSYLFLCFTDCGRPKISVSSLAATARKRDFVSVVTQAWRAPRQDHVDIVCTFVQQTEHRTVADAFTDGSHQLRRPMAG